jgi:hypothetical protein
MDPDRLTNIPSDSRRERARDEWAAAEMAGRTVWCLAGDRPPAGTVEPEDVVVLADPRAMASAVAARERGGHVVLLGIGATPADAFLFGERRASVGGRRVERIALTMPTSRMVALAEVDLSQRSAWMRLLAAIVHDDRRELVGGTRRARPLVAAR